MAATATLLREAPVGEKMKELRESLALTQTTLAVMAGITRREVDRYERGLPVTLECRRRIHQHLWAQKTRK